ncbi:MAG: glutamate formimidoyltransferase [Chloroflexota bacterium]|nr:glutamate formimidoyltransferase [Chloroflexota bacterium]
MDQIVECVPNFSEGRRKQVVDEIVDAMAIPGVKMLDREMDADHNRSVITFAGEPRAVEDAAFRGIAAAARLIDLDAHRGEHPRIGATDVVPFVPVRGVTMDDCVAIARRLGARVARELDIPVYLYERAATRPERRDLAYIRRGEYEALKQEIATNPDRAPDFGPTRVGKAGATVIGARPYLIAFNVNLANCELRIAKEIARVIREKGGGLKSVKANGFWLRDRNIAQVSMNLTDFTVTGMLTAFNTVKAEAEKRGVQVLESEIVGLVPLDALTQIAAQALKLPALSANQVVELKVFGE